MLHNVVARIVPHRSMSFNAPSPEFVVAHLHVWAWRYGWDHACPVLELNVKLSPKKSSCWRLIWLSGRASRNVLFPFPWCLSLQRCCSHLICF